MTLSLMVAVFALTVCAYAYASETPNDSYQWLMVSFAIAGSCLYFAWHTQRYGRLQWLSISFLFALSYSIVCFQIPILHLLGYRIYGPLSEFIWADEAVMNRSVALSTLGLLSFYTGALLLTSPRRAPQATVEEDSSFRPSRLITGFTAISYALFLATAGSYVLGEYTPDDASPLASYFYKLFKVGLTTLIVVSIARATRSSPPKSFRTYLQRFGRTTLIILTAHLLLSLLVGDRGAIIYFSLLTFAPYFLRYKKIRLPLAIAGFLAFSLIFAVIGEVRQTRFAGGSYSERISTALAQASLLSSENKLFDAVIPLASTVELGASVRALNHALAKVPADHQHTNGVIQLSYIYSLVPGMSRLMNNVLFDGNPIYDGSANFVTYLIQGPNPSYGDGTSAVADLYIDFGPTGVVIGLVLFGVFVGRYEPRLFSGPQRVTFAWVATMVFLADAPYLGRSAILLDFSNVILVYALYRLAATLEPRREIANRPQ